MSPWIAPEWVYTGGTGRGGPTQRGGPRVAVKSRAAQTSATMMSLRGEEQQRGPVAAGREVFQEEAVDAVAGPNRRIGGFRAVQQGIFWGKIGVGTPRDGPTGKVGPMG